MSNQFSFPLSVKTIYEPESKDAPYIAYAPELDVSSCGPTEEDARRHLDEVVQIIFEEAERNG
jgi:predicted RNase H-like HicB family nuclease